MLALEESVDNIRWSSFIAERLIKLIGWILKLFLNSIASKLQD